ncbi:MAG TPA: hypothetical protein VMS64_11430 [Candidatus Methylomirabilis sp.]|nr:hypothetical protein [Candidatus Methylomirabilis sp.]
MKAGSFRGVVLAALMAAGCATSKLDTVELTSKGPTAEELYTQRSQTINGRAPTFDERRRWEAEIEERVWGYLRQHPELEQTNRYSDFRFWWQVTTGSTPAEVRVLLLEPTEQTIDPARMAALAEGQWGEIEPKAKEAWFYQPAWILYFDDSSVVGIVHRISSVAPRD